MANPALVDYTNSSNYKVYACHLRQIDMLTTRERMRAGGRTPDPAQIREVDELITRERMRVSVRNSSTYGLLLSYYIEPPVCDSPTSPFSHAPPGQ